jgi:hypothetical protein
MKKKDSEIVELKRELEKKDHTIENMETQLFFLKDSLAQTKAELRQVPFSIKCEHSRHNFGVLS